MSNRVERDASRSSRPRGVALRLLAVAVLFAALIPRSVPAEEYGEDSGAGSGTGVGYAPDFRITPDPTRVSSFARGMITGQDPRASVIFSSVEGAGGSFAPAGGAGATANSQYQQVPFRSPAPAFSRNILITRALGNYPVNTEPHIAVNPDDPDHLVVGTIDFNFEGVTLYVSFDAGETWTGPQRPRPFRGDIAAGGDPVIAFGRDGTVYVAQLTIGLQEYQIGTVLSQAVVSSLTVNRSTDGGITWDDGIVAVRGTVSTASLPGEDGRERGTITTSFVDKEWITVGPSPTDPEKDVIYISYTDFETTDSLIYADEVPFLSTISEESTIRVVSSEDGGQTWTEPTDVSPTTLFFAGSSREDEGEAAGAGSESGSPFQTQPILQTGEALLESRRYVQGSQPVVLSDGTLAVAYFDSTNDGGFEGLAATMIAISTDGGKTFSEPIQATVYKELRAVARSASFRWNGSQFPQLAKGPDDQLYIVSAQTSRERSTDDGDIIFLSSTDKGATWSEAKRVNQDDTDRLQFLPSIAVSPDGVIHIFWGDMRDDPSEIRYHVYYTRSEDGGDTFGFEIPEQNFNVPDTRVTDFPSSILRVCGGCAPEIGDYWASAASDEDVFTVWGDTRLGEFGGFNVQIAFARQTAIAPAELFLNPPSGTAGRIVDIQGFGFQPQSNVQLFVSGQIVAFPRTDDQGQFQISIYMPLTGEGPTSISAFDETGNSATASFFTEFGFDSLQESLDEINGRLDAVENGGGEGSDSGESASGSATPIATPSS